MENQPLIPSESMTPSVGSVPVTETTPRSNMADRLLREAAWMSITGCDLPGHSSSVYMTPEHAAGILFPTESTKSDGEQ